MFVEKTDTSSAVTRAHEAVFRGWVRQGNPFILKAFFVSRLFISVLYDIWLFL